MLDKLFMKFLTEKERSLKSLLLDIETTTKYEKGLTQFLENIDEAEMTEANIRQKFKTMMKVVNYQNNIITKLLYLNLVYMQGSNFDSDVGTALSKMGKGEEALKAMLNKKMKGGK